MYYLAYGSNLNLAQMKRRCPNSKPIATATLPNWELYFNLHADIRPQKGSSVLVGIWEIADEDWLMLDIYEGYPNYYKKIQIGEYEGEPCIAYVMTDMKKDLCNCKRPQTSYFKTIEQGYEDFGMDVEELYKAYENQFGDRRF